MKNLIYIEGEKTYQFDSVNELYELIFGKKYFELTEKEKYIGNYIMINKEFLTNRKGN